MKNIEMRVTEENKLIIEVDLEKDYGPSKSGKTNIVATTAGNVPVPEQDGVKIGINCFKNSSQKK